MQVDSADVAPDASAEIDLARTSHATGPQHAAHYEESPRVILIATVFFVLQFIGLMVYSWIQYHRFNLGVDFASVNQAATEIGKGNLNPYSTILGSSFLQNHFGLILWPIALLLVIVRTPFLFLIIQNACLVATGMITFKWASAFVASRKIPKGFAYGILAIAGVLLLINPLVSYSAALDFHFEAIATFFAVFAAYDAWGGRTRRAWVWVALCLLCGDLGGLYIAGVGISALLAGRATRRTGLLYLLAGVLWVGLITALHANQGDLLDSYAYLAGRSKLPAGVAGVAVVLGGLVEHPARAFDALRSKDRLIWRYFPPGGVIGIITPWGIGVPAIVLLSSALQSNTLFIGEAFQQFPVMPFVLIGTVALLSALVATNAHLFTSLRRWTRWWSDHRVGRRVAAGVLMIVILLGGVRFAHEYLVPSFTYNASGDILPSSEASALGIALARTPPDAEVIASLDISGRFSARRWAYTYDNTTTPLPLRTKTVELVMDTANDPYFTPAQITAAVRYVSTRFHARTLLHRDGVWELGWSNSPPGVIYIP
jgi:hypothetical protein